MKLLTKTFILAALPLCSASAVQVIDQNQPLGIGAWASISPTYDSYQTFKQSAGNISGGGVRLSNPGLHPFSPSEVFTIGVFSDNPFTNPGSLLASGSATAGPDFWVDGFWSAVNVTPGSTLYLSIKSTSDTGAAGADQYSVTTYTDGNAGYRGNNFGDLFDLAFRTYSGGSQASVPDGGSTIALFGLAMTAVARARRKFSI
ncbi:MAG: VPDSG-CTERM sorting domain-containing protein [Verrucomicrobiaceae bacterium]|nr:MAG: VPDSG-CTERM sorting domain-containing protein [Verrucomicrobiaceae bacterium]